MSDWCKGFCRTCGTGCGQYCEEIKQLKEENERYAQQSLTYLDTVAELRKRLSEATEILDSMASGHDGRCSYTDDGCLRCKALEYFNNMGV